MNAMVQPSTSPSTDRDAWSNYWTSLPENAAGCVPGMPRAAATALECRWAAFLASLPDGARVLDLGTGGGAVPRFAASLARKLQFVGVDYVEGVQPHLPVGTEYFAGVRMESLPFADASFDAATSQFSIEYAGAEAVAELLRVLKPGAPIMVIAHHADSVIVSQNRERLAAIDELSVSDGLFETAIRMAGEPARLAADWLSVLQPILVHLRGLYPRQGVVGDASAFVQSLATRSDAGTELRRAMHEMGMEAVRLRALLRAALDEGSARRLAETLSRRGHAFQLGAVRVSDAGPLLAWHLQACQAAATLS